MEEIDFFTKGKSGIVKPPKKIFLVSKVQRGTPENTTETWDSISVGKRIKIDAEMKNIVRGFRKFFKNAMNEAHKRKFYGWVTETFRVKARELL